MKRLYIRAVCAAFAFAASACTGDPTASLRNGAAALSVTPSQVIRDTGVVTPVVVVVRDGQQNPVPGDVAAVSQNVRIATVKLDTSRVFPDGATHPFLVTTTDTLFGGSTTVKFSSASVDSTMVVMVNPVQFPGALSGATPAGGSVLTITSTADLKLGKVTGVTFGGIPGTLLTHLTDQATVIVPFSDAAKPRIAGVYPAYMGSTFTFTLPSTVTVTQTGNFWAGDSTDATAPTLALPTDPAAPVRMITTLYGGSNGGVCVQPTAQAPCMFYQFTLADTASLDVAVNWDGRPVPDSTDINLFACPAPYAAAACLAAPLAQDIKAKGRPAEFLYVFSAGRYFIIVERKATQATTGPTGPTVAPRNFYWTITRAANKNPTKLTTSPNPTSGVVNVVKLQDAATLGGGFGTPTGNIVFRLFDPTDPTCSGTPRLTDQVTVAGVGTYNTTGTGFTADMMGIWRWTAEYTGDALSAGKKTACDDEQVAVTAVPPGGGTGTGTGVGPAPVNLGTAANYVILAKSAISNVPTSAITGDLGLSPAAAAAITGFALTLPAGGAFSTSAQVNGKVYASDYAAPTPSNLTTAVNDMQTAYVNAAGRPTPDYTELAAGNLGGLTLPPGLYKWSNTVLIPTDVTLSGGPNDTWIFQIAGGLTQSSATNVILAGGAVAQNVVWQVGGAVSIGTTADLEGVVLSLTSIALHNGATANSRLLAQTAVTLDHNTIVQPGP